MKKLKIFKNASALLLTGILASGVLQFANAQNSLDSFKIGEKFIVNELKIGDKAYIIDYKFEDVTGDKIKDNIILVGNKENKDDIYADTLTVVVQDESNKKYSKSTYKDFGGYGGKLFIGDFSKDKINDVMVSADTGGSGGVISHLIATFKDNKPFIIFGEKENTGIEIDGKYIDNFKAEINFKNINKKVNLDLDFNRESYIENEIYNVNGKLLGEINPWIDPFSLLEAVDYDGDNVFELEGNQHMSGICHADGISQVKSVWKYENSKWSLKRLQYSTDLIKH